MNTSKQINAMIGLLLLLLVGIGFYTIWDPFRAEAENDRTREEIAMRAARTYGLNCRQCHGNNGEGRVGPALNPEFRAKNPDLIQFADPTKLKETQPLVTNTLVCGRIGKLMPPWSQAQGGSLTDEQIRQLMILITDPPKDAWAKLEELTAEENKTIPLPDVAEITAGGAITGANAQVCGQRAPVEATPDTSGPVEISTSLQETTTDNKFSVTRFGIPAGQQVTLAVQNQGSNFHNVHVQGVKGADGKDIATQLQQGGKTDTINFTIAKAGNYTFICDAHPTDMKGVLIVQ